MLLSLSLPPQPLLVQVQFTMVQIIQLFVQVVEKQISLTAVETLLE